jgi:hypothetical protein
MPARNSSRNFQISPVLRKVAMARRSSSAREGEKPAPTMAIFIACSWNSGTPSVFFKTPSRPRGMSTGSSPFRRRR